MPREAPDHLAYSCCNQPRGDLRCCKQTAHDLQVGKQTTQPVDKLCCCSRAHQSGSYHDTLPSCMATLRYTNMNSSTKYIQHTAANVCSITTLVAQLHREIRKLSSSIPAADVRHLQVINMPVDRLYTSCAEAQPVKVACEMSEMTPRHTCTTPDMVGLQSRAVQVQ